MTDQVTGRWPSRSTVGVKQVTLRDVEHGVIFYDPNMYAAHVNRGGIWNFGDGEIVVAHLVNTHCPYDDAKWVSHGYRMKTTGVMLHRSFDHGRTWPQNQSRKWIWHNDRTDEQVKQWLRPTVPEQRQRIDMSDPNAIIHFNIGHYCYSRHANDPSIAFSLRSADRGKTWEDTATRINVPDAGSHTVDQVLVANLGHVRFDNGVLGVAGFVYDGKSHDTTFFISVDNGLSWQPTGTIVRSDAATRFTYVGVHQLPDGRLLCCMHKVPRNLPCVSFSSDGGNTWTPPQYITGPQSYNLDVNCPPDEIPLGDWRWVMPEPSPGWPAGYFDPQNHRAPCALVLRDGRIVVVFNRRGARSAGGNGIHGVISDDLGQTWSREFTVWGEAYSTDNGYPVLTELGDNRVFVAYYATVKEQPETIEFFRCVRHIRSTAFTI